MYVQERGRKPRNTAFMLDVAHILMGIAIVALAVVSFLNPEGHMLLFPVIFFLAAILNLINGIYRIHQSRRERKRKFPGITATVFGGLLLILSFISAVSIWWR